jgi:hypothetical protein
VSDPPLTDCSIQKLASHDRFRRHGPFGEPQLLDDLNDHWTCNQHCQEQISLLQILHDVALQLPSFVTILSGDVHTSCVQELQPVPEGLPLMVNIVSSGVRHAPMPSAVAAVIKSLSCQSDLHLGDSCWNVFPRQWQKVKLLLLSNCVHVTRFTIQQASGTGPQSGSYFSQVGS